jgi:hypothetical protein
MYSGMIISSHVLREGRLARTSAVTPWHTLPSARGADGSVTSQCLDVEGVAAGV